LNEYLKIEHYPKIRDDLIQEYLNNINENKRHWDKPFFIDTQSYIDFNEIINITRSIPEKKRKNIIVLATGGSVQTLLALKHSGKQEIYPITSSRSVELNRCLEETESSNSIVIPISRGGETVDVNSTIGVFLERGYDFVGVSSQGTMYEILKKINCPILKVPDISGRFAASISNVAIFPAYLAGVNTAEFLKGLEVGYNEYMNYKMNDASLLAIYIFHLYQKGVKVLFSMPYSQNLEGSVGLFVQEISESTGKDNKGLMGTYQSAPLCQHSVLEYLLGGTKGAVLPILWLIENELNQVNLTSSIDYIDNKDSQEVVNYQAHATFQALLEQEVPSVLLSLYSPTEKGIGNLIAFIQSTVYYLCLLLDVNWANNPKVVIGKKICNNALQSNKSFEDMKKMRKNIASNKFNKFI
jgi:glucose-6-phosphate isomerase